MDMPIATDLVEHAMHLSREDRADLALQLILSVETDPPEQNVEQEWAAEIERRISTAKADSRIGRDDRAAGWYGERVKGLGKRFLSEVRATLADIRTRPEEPAIISKFSPWKIRSRRIKRFPYAVIYELRENGCVVVAVAHSSRRPGYWRSRRG